MRQGYIWAVLVAAGLGGCGSNDKSDEYLYLNSLPVAIGSFTAHVSENYTGPVGQVTLTPAQGTSLSKVELGGEGSEKFEIGSDGELSVTQPLDYEITPEYHLNVTAYNQAGLASSESITIFVDDQVDTVPVLDKLSGSVIESAPVGAAVGKVSVLSSGDSPIVKMELSGDGAGNFSIAIDGTITVSSFAKLDFETTSSYHLKATATNAAGVSESVDITITIIDDPKEPVILTVTQDHDPLNALGASLDGNGDWQPQPVTFTFTFSASVSGFVSSDIAVTGGVKGTFAGSGTKYMLSVKPSINSNTPISISVPSDVSADAQQNGNLPASATQKVDTYVPFVTVWNTANPGVSGSTQIRITTACNNGCDYGVEWGDGTTSSHVDGNITHTYSSSALYTVRIKGKFDRVVMDTAGGYDPKKLVEIKQWGSIPWSSMKNAYKGCEYLKLTAADRPDLSRVRSCASMFEGASMFNADMNSWDMSKITDMSRMFAAAAAFNGAIGEWDVSAVTDMSSMFEFATGFNQNLSAWDTSGVVDMTHMFYYAYGFTGHDLSIWNVGSVSAHADFGFAWGSGNTEPLW